MGQFYITKVSVNPLEKAQYSDEGKEIPNELLNREWIEFANFSDHIIDLKNIQLCRQTHQANGSEMSENRIVEFHGDELFGWDSVRVHTGRGESHRSGKIFHVFLSRYLFLWNVVSGDCIVIRSTFGSIIDKACFTTYPSEGQLLYRMSNTMKLEAVDISEKLSGLG